VIKNNSVNNKDLGKVKPSDIDYEQLKKLEFFLMNKYGALISMNDMAQIFHKSYDGFRISMVNAESPSAIALGQARKKIGRRVYFRSLDVAKIIMA